MTDKVEDFLEHFGVKGMRWGVRKKETGQGFYTRAGQRYVDQVKRVAEGKGSTWDRLNTWGFTRKMAKRQLRLLKDSQDKINRGELSVVSILARAKNIKVKDLNL